MPPKLPPTRSYPGARALLLPRVSTLRQKEEGTSLATQEKEMRQHAEDRQYEIVACLQDAHTGTDLYRPALNEARNMVHDNMVDVIIVYAYDRFFRNNAHQTIFMYDARQFGVAVESVTEKVDDSIAGRMTSSMLGFIAEMDREKILERMTRGLRGRVESGRIKTGATPLYGYKWVDGSRGNRETHDYYEIDEEVAWVIRYIFEEICKLNSTRTIARMLDEQHVLTPGYYLESKGYKPRLVGTGEWNYGSVKAFVKNPAYMGKYRALRRRNEDIFTEDEDSGRIQSHHIQRNVPDEESVLLPSSSCPAIVSEEMWYAAQEAMKRNRENSPRNTFHKEATLLGRGFIFCGHCGRKANVNRKRTKPLTDPDHYHYQYFCQYTDSNHGPRCPHGFSMPAKDLDDAVWAYVMSLLGTNPKTGHSFLEEAALGQYDGPESELAAKQSALRATLLVERDKKAELRNWERTLADAMKQEYNPTHIGRVQYTLDQLDRELAGIAKTRSQLEREVQYIVRDQNTIRTAIQSLEPLRRELQEADWSVKRRWLYYLGISIYVYRKGVWSDKHGRCWEVRQNGRGLQDIIGDLQDNGDFAGSTL